MSDLNEHQRTPRRSSRMKKPTTKALENKYVKTLSRSGLVGNVSSSSESSSEEDYSLLETPGTPSVLQVSENLQGDKMFQIQKRKSKASLMQKVRQVRELNIQKTPHVHRKRIEKAIQEDLLSDRESDQDLFSDLESDRDPFSDSGSEYDPCEASPSASSSGELESDSSSKRETRPKTPRMNLRVANASNVRTRTNKYTIKTDDYFSNQASKKIVTSDHTLDKLETPRLAQHELQKLLKNMEISEEHHKCINRLLKDNKSVFSKWLYLLHENFNILLYGLGSKRSVIEEFRNEFLNDHPVIVVNGFFPSLSIKDVLDGIILDLLELKKNPANVYECCDLIEQEFEYLPDVHLYLIVHNIDGEMLRNNKAQNVLARLASVENIHLIASIDHINGPLIWDHSKLSQFNYTWWDLTTYLPYIDETSFESSLMIQKSGEFALSSLRNVFLSLTTNSKGIYLLIVKYQLGHSKTQHYEGLAFKDLYSSCREAFLVSSDLALRAQLTEFVDHKMVKFRRSGDGVEYLVIPISNILLQKFLDEHSS